jgi:hypothetical protein
MEDIELYDRGRKVRAEVAGLKESTPPENPGDSGFVA